MQQFLALKITTTRCDARFIYLSALAQLPSSFLQISTHLSKFKFYDGDDATVLIYKRLGQVREKEEVV
jgi:hypothetical protein